MESTPKQFAFFWIFFLVPMGLVFTELFFTIVRPSSLRNVISQLGFNQMRSLSLLIYDVGTGVAVFILYSLLKRKGLGWHALGFRGRLTKKGIFGAVVACLLAVALYPLIEAGVSALGISMYWREGTQAPMRSHTLANALYATLGAAILAPLTEDTVFRGYVFQMFTERFNALTAGGLSTLVFAAIHVPFFGPGLAMYIVPWTAISLYLFKRFDNLYVPMLYHALNNLFAYVLLPFWI